jgi:hypothetical protein
MLVETLAKCKINSPYYKHLLKEEEQSFFNENEQTVWALVEKIIHFPTNRINAKKEWLMIIHSFKAFKIK